MSARGLLAALQLADSTLPIGRFVHSHGLEAWLRAHEPVAAERLCELVESFVCDSVASLDGVIVAHAHGARSLDALTGLDAALTAHKLTPAARKASMACGRQLAALSRELTDDPLVAAYSEAVAARRTDGNVAVVFGTTGRAAGLSADTAVSIELRSAATAMLSAALRLGALKPTQAQVLLMGLAPTLERGAQNALAADLDDLHSTMPELETYTLVHVRSAARLFVT